MGSPPVPDPRLPGGPRTAAWASPAPDPAARPRPRRIKPRLVDQMRILLWFQFYLALLWLLAMVFWTAHVADLALRLDATLPVYDVLRTERDRLEVLLLLLAGVVVLLALAAGTLRVGSVVNFPLTLLAQAAMVAGIGYSLWVGIYAGLGAMLLVAMGVWVVVDLFRGETVHYLLRRPPVSVVPIDG